MKLRNVRNYDQIMALLDRQNSNTRNKINQVILSKFNTKARLQIESLKHDIMSVAVKKKRIEYRIVSKPRRTSQPFQAITIPAHKASQIETSSTWYKLSIDNLDERYPVCSCRKARI